jgi:probable F420-dependent oxidoreductase
VRVYAGMDPRLPLREVGPYAARVEAVGFDGLHVPETIHDAFTVALLAAEHTERIIIRTSMALAFVRSPMLVAYAAWDLAKFSGGRFHLGLATQIRQNIEERYGMPWAEPVARLREYVATLHALFDSFRTGDPPRVDGRHYSLSRLQPYFNPGPDAHTFAPAIWLGGVNEGVCRLAGEVAEGFVTHPTNSNPRYLEQLCLPNLRAGADRAGRDLSGFELVCGTPVITAAGEAELEAERQRQRRLFAFLYSTPAYQRTLELYGWEDLAPRLRQIVRTEGWDDLHNVVSDELLDTLIPTAVYAELPDVLLDRFGRLAGGVLLPVPEDPTHDDALAMVVGALQRAG